MTAVSLSLSELESILSIVCKFRQELDRRFLLKIDASPIGLEVSFFGSEIRLIPSQDELTFRIDLGLLLQVDLNEDVRLLPREFGFEFPPRNKSTIDWLLQSRVTDEKLF